MPVTRAPSLNSVVRQVHKLNPSQRGEVSSFMGQAQLAQRRAFREAVKLHLEHPLGVRRSQPTITRRAGQDKRKAVRVFQV